MCVYRCGKMPTPGCPADNREPEPLDRCHYVAWGERCRRPAGHDDDHVYRTRGDEPVDVPFEDVYTADGVYSNCTRPGPPPTMAEIEKATKDFREKFPTYCPASMMGRGCEQAKGHSGRCVFTRTLRDPDFLWRAPT